MLGNNSTIQLSLNETNILHLKTGRCVAVNIDEKWLFQQIIDNSFDVCRLTVSASDEYVSSKLDKTGLPYFYSGSITRYHTSIANLPERSFLHPNLEYEKYDGTQDDLLLRLLIDTWGDNPVGYYRSPILKHLIKKEDEIISVFEFYKKFNLQKNYPNNTMMFMKINHEYVGFFALNIIEDRLESHIGGILAPFRNDGYFFDMQEYIRRFCIQHQLKYFQFGARNENLRVNEIFKKFGYDSIGTDIIFHIVPLLDFKFDASQVIENIEITDFDMSKLHLIFSNAAFILMKEHKIYTHCNYYLKVIPLKTILKGKYHLIVSIPVIGQSELFCVLKLFDIENNLACITYFHAS